MKNQKRKFTAEFKVQVLREHLENQIAVGKICEQSYLAEPLKHSQKTKAVKQTKGKSTVWKKNLRTKIP